jgi:hypothetical protein
VAVLRKEFVLEKLHDCVYPDTFGQANSTSHVMGRVSYLKARMVEEVTICDATVLYIAS